MADCGDQVNDGCSGDVLFKMRRCEPILNDVMIQEGSYVRTISAMELRAEIERLRAECSSR